MRKKYLEKAQNSNITVPRRPFLREVSYSAEITIMISVKNYKIKPHVSWPMVLSKAEGETAYVDTYNIACSHFTHSTGNIKIFFKSEGIILHW